MNNCEHECPLLSMSLIPLTQGQYAVIDTDDFEGLSKRKWCAAKNAAGVFRAKTSKQPYFMHRVLMGLKEGERRGCDRLVVDHINHNKLDK